MGLRSQGYLLGAGSSKAPAAHVSRVLGLDPNGQYETIFALAIPGHEVAALPATRGRRTGVLEGSGLVGNRDGCAPTNLFRQMI